MAKATRGKKKPVRKARQPRQPKSANASVRSDEELRISLFSCVYERSRSIEDVLDDVTKIFDYIKQTGPYAIQAPSIPKRNKRDKETVAAPMPTEAPEASDNGAHHDELKHQQKKSHFEEDRILM